MDEAATTRRRRGGRAETPEEFPSDDAAYRTMSPAERMAALQRLSRRLFAIKIAGDLGERRHPRSGE